MEEIQSTRRGSGIFDGGNPSIQSFTSAASLRAHAADPAGITSITPAGVSTNPVSGWDPPQALTSPNAAISGWEDHRVTATPQAPQAPFYKRRWFIISSIIIIPLGIALLFIILFPVIRAIVQLVVKRSTLSVSQATISSPQNDSFQLALLGNVSHTGIFSATIVFTKPINVSWVEADGTVTPIGSLSLDQLSAKQKHAVINQTQTFTISNETAFALFATQMINVAQFTWMLESDDLHVQALKFPVAKGISFSKLLTLQGFDGFNGGVALQDLQLPQDNPAGGIDFIAQTLLTNPSPFSIDLGTVIFALSYQNLSLGMGTSTNTAIGNGPNPISLSGVLEPHNNSADLVIMSQLFTNYINGVNSMVVATGMSTLQSDGSSIAWLSTALQHLNLDVPFKPAVPINPIQSITIGDLALQFDEALPWTPLTASNSVQATLQLPFGFSLSIGDIANDFTIMMNGNPVAGLSTLLGASTSSIEVLGTNDTAGTINISIVDTRLSCPDPQHPTFAAFNTELTNMAMAEFQLTGHSQAVANTSIGQITLNPINVNVTTSLNGLQGLKGMTSIESVDVTGGTSQGISLAIQVSIHNPSSLILNVGDLTLQLFRDNVALGTALLPNLTLQMGNNTILASSIFEANSSPQGQQTLDDFVGKTDVQLSIAGFNGSTGIASLVEAFQTLDISVVLPGLKTNLLDLATLTVLPTTGRENNISHVTVSLANPFSAALHITKISSSITAFDIPLGVIDTVTNFTSNPNTTTVSPSLDLIMNFDPAALFTVTRALAVEANLNVAPLDEIVRLGGIQYLQTPEIQSVSNNNPEPRQSNLFDGFDLPTFVQAAFKMLKSDVQLTTEVTIGDYTTTLQYNQSALTTSTDQTLNFILPVLAQPIVQMIVGGSNLGINTVLISNPQQESFGTNLSGAITNAGPFNAKISFPSGLLVAWQGKPLGTIRLGDVQVTGDVGGEINADSQFEVADVDHLADFTKVLLTDETFVWDISGENLTVSALGIDIPGVTLSSKSVTLKGFNGLKNGINIKSFDLPSNDPAGGIHLTLDVTVTNPSQVGIELSSIGFNNFVGDVMIGPVTSTDTITLSPGASTELSLVGRLIPQTSPEGLATISGIFNTFVHGMDSNIIVQGSSAGPADVTWLNEGIKALQVSTVLPNQGPLNIIKSIDLNELELIFTPDTAFDPSTSSSSTDAAFTLPFAFPLDITALEQTISVGFQGSTFAQLAIPKGPSNTDVANRIIHLTFKNVPFAAMVDTHAIFSDFVAATTTGGTQTLQLTGNANADASTAVGLLSLSDIGFSVDSKIQGLEGLTARPVTISDLDVNHGFPDFLLIKVNGALFNPSNLTIGTGDVSFSLDFLSQTIGSADISNLLIIPGNASYPIDVHFAPQGPAVDAGRALLESFIEGTNVDTTILGSTESTPIDSLKSALSQIRLSPVTIPGLKQTLITSASLIFPSNIVQTGIASTSFTLSNPFTASINILTVAATATFHNLTLGKINNVDLSSNPITAAGHSNVASQQLPLAFNLDPLTIIDLLLLTSQESGTSLGPLPSLFQFVMDNPNFKPSITTSVDSQPATCMSGQQFNIDGAILNSLKGLKVNLAVDSSVKLDDFATDLTFNQLGVPAITDTSALFLIGAVAAPITQNLVDQAVLKFTSADISNIQNDGFNLALKGSLTNIGPLDALITFTEPVSVAFQGQTIAQIALPPICAAANAGVPDYEANAQLTITDQAAFTNFAVFLLHNPSFEWTISTTKLRVTALGTIFDNVSLSKVVSFDAFNGLPGVTISNFQLPSDDPTGGIHIETDAIIPSQAQLSIDLGTVTFQTFFQNTFIGSLTGTNLSLAAKAVTKTHLSGTIVPQSGPDLDNVGTLFSTFLAGGNQTLVTKGDSVQPPGSNQPVTWLSTAFKTLSLNVILPGEKLPVIQSITLNDLNVTIETQDQAFAPLTSSQSTLVQYKNPFGFSLQVIASGQTITLGMHGTNIAQLQLPKEPVNGGVSTGNLANLDISFQNQPLKSLNNEAFEQLLSAVTNTESVQLDLSGSANVTARTSIGDIPISGIPFDVSSSLKGLDSFGGTAGLDNVTVTGSGGVGGSQFIIAPLITTLQNPSNVSLNTLDVSLPVIFDGVTIGSAAISTFDLKSGENIINAEFHYEPEDANDTVAQGFLTSFIQTDNQLDLTIQGDSTSSPFASLQPALSNLKLSTSLGALDQPTFITDINVIITLDTFTTNQVEVNFDVHNPLDADLVLEFVQSDAGLMGQVFAQFSQGFDNFVVPPGMTVNSGTFGNVNLTQGIDAALNIIPFGVLDVFAAATLRIGSGGYEIPFLKLNQTSVPTVYTLDLDGPLQQAKPSSNKNSTEILSSVIASALSTGVVKSSKISSSMQTVSAETHQSTRATVVSTIPKQEVTSAAASVAQTTASSADPQASTPRITAFPSDVKQQTTSSLTTHNSATTASQS